MDVMLDHFRSRAKVETGRDSLDSRTWDDLNLDDVFQALDRTESTLGQQALYFRMRSTWTTDELETFEALVSRASEDVPLRQRAQLSLVSLRDPDGYDVWWLAQPGVVERRSWHVVFPILSAAMLALAITATVSPAAILPLAAGALLNVVIRGVSGRRLAPLTIPFRQAATVIATGQALAFLGQRARNALLEPLRTDVPRLGRLHRYLRWAGRDPAASGELAALLMEYLNLMFLVDLNVAYFAAAEMRHCAPSLVRVASAVGEVDAAIAVASYRAGTADWSRPVFVPPGDPATMTDVWHPFVANAVPNSLRWAPPNGFLVTGSNMSGKTTFIRAIGVNVVLAQTIHTCMASRWEAPMLCVRSCIGRSDDLLAGKSYYLVEVEAVLGLVTASQSPAPHLLLFDELFRGTNAVERVSAAFAVLTEVLDASKGSKPHLVLAATHDGELVEWLGDKYAACHFGDVLGPDGITFTYKLAPGPATTRNAIALLRLHDAPHTLIERALDRAAYLDAQRRT